MKFTLIICTYMRPKPLLKLLQSVKEQTLYPDEIIIVDGSANQETIAMLEQNRFQNLHYFSVSEEDLGLTRQRNFGIAKAGKEMDILCFLDDDTVLEPDYFEQLLKTFEIYPEAFGVGGYISNETPWEKVKENEAPNINEFTYDSWKRKDGSRFVLRKKLGLDSNRPPGFSPLFSHGRSVGFLPPSGKIYEVEQVMGGASAFRKSVFDIFQFSTYFEGYGLYEDADFSFRVAKTGKLYINTAAKLSHFHNPSGRPNQYQYGKMVVRNGYYVWRIKNPDPTFKAKLKWHAITLLLMAIRFTNTFTTNKPKEAFIEALGRKMGWFSLFWKVPKNK